MVGLSYHESGFEFNPLMTHNTENATIYRFGPFTLHPAEFRLYREDQVIELEPKLFNLLSLLVGSAGRVVTQDELIDQIWQGRVVTPNAISRAVYALRQILDEPKDHDSMIKTVRGRGYQFDATVQVVQGSSAAPKPALSGVWRPVLLLCIALVSWWFLQRSNSPRPDPGKPAEAYLSMVILPWNNDHSDPRMISLSHTLINDLMLQLRSSPINQVIGPDSLSGLTTAANDLLAIQQATHADYVLEGVVAEPTADLLRLHLTLYHHVDGFLEPYDLGSYDFPWPAGQADLVELYVQRKNTAREVVRLIKPKAQMKLDDQGMTHDPAVYRMMVSAHHMGRSNDCEQLDRARVLLEKAVAKDPGFAYGWHELMTLYFKNIWICGGSREHYDLALEAAEQVDRLAPGRHESVNIARNAVLLEQNQVEQAYAINRRLPDHKNRLVYLSISNLRYAGFLQQANALINEILLREPYFYSSHPVNQAPNTVLYLNRFAQHLGLLAEPGNQYHDYYRALNLHLSGQQEQALAALRMMLADQPSGLFIDFGRALQAIIEDRPEVAIDLVEQTISQRQAKGQSDGEITYKQVQLLAMAGRAERALQMLEVTLAQGFFAANYWQSDPALESLINSPRFNALYAQARARHRAFAERFELTAEF